MRYFLYARKSTLDREKQVQSIESQVNELTELAGKNGWEIHEIIKETGSAKRPGRPKFNRMLAEIEKGTAQGILCWKLDRLARNPLDGGRIIQMLQDKQLKEIRTHFQTHRPEDHTIPISVELSMSTQYSRDLSENVKRGNRTKIAKGWMPGNVPVGYLNKLTENREDRTILTDPVRFDIIKKSWHRLLYERYNLNQVYNMALKDGLVSKRGLKYSKGCFYQLFKNPFYYGYFYFGDKSTLHHGAHQPMITRQEFELAQDIIHGREKPKQRKNKFDYTGLFRCAKCGSMVVGYLRERLQKNGNYHRYVYYRCTKHRDPKCDELQVKEEQMNLDTYRILEQLEIPTDFRQWAMEVLKQETSHDQELEDSQLQKRKVAIENCRKKMDKLLDLHLAGTIDQDSFSAKQKEIQKELSRLEGVLEKSSSGDDSWYKMAEQMLTFAELAKLRYQTGSQEAKRSIIGNIGLNLLISDRRPAITLLPPFEELKKIAPEARELSKSFEPVQGVAKQRVYADKYHRSSLWWAIQDLNL